MKERYIIITIDSLSELLKDYMTPEDLPTDAVPMKLMLKPTEQGKLAIEFESDSWSGTEAPLQVTFDIRRVYSVGS